MTDDRQRADVLKLVGQGYKGIYLMKEPLRRNINLCAFIFSLHLVSACSSNQTHDADADSSQENDSSVDVGPEMDAGDGDGDYDDTSPTVVITTEDPTEIDSDGLLVEWTASDDGGLPSCKWHIGEAPNELIGAETGTSPTATSGYVEGSNTLFVGCVDSDGNWGSDSITVFLSPPTYYGEYWVTQDGSGTGTPGTEDHPYSVSEFNDLESVDTSGGDVVFYFSGTVSSEVFPPSGSSSGYIILDGFEEGNYDAISEEDHGQCVIEGTQGSRHFCISLWDASYGIGNGRDYVIVQDFELRETTAGVYAASGSDHITVRRNFIHDTDRSGAYITTDSHEYIPCSWVTIGGRLGDGNSIKNVGVGTSGADVTLSGTGEFIVSYNHLYATKADGLPTDRGIDGVVPVNEAYNGLIEYNSIHSHNDDYFPNPFDDGVASNEGRGEDGIDIKDDSGGEGSHDIIVRFNHIYDHRNQSNIHPQAATYRTYIYGNFLHHSNWGTNLKNCRDGIYLFSNIMFQEYGAAIAIYRHNATGWGGDAGEIHVFNNTISECSYDDDLSSVYTNITVLDGIEGTNSLSIINNIFIRSRPNYSSWRNRQLYIEHDTSLIDFNRYYWPGETSTMYIDGTNADAIGGHPGVELNGSEGDPGLEDWGNGDFRISEAGSAVVGAGDDISRTIATVTIQGVDHVVDTRWGLGPNTDWTTVPPTVEVLDRDLDNWDQGAYVWVAP